MISDLAMLVFLTLPLLFGGALVAFMASGKSVKPTTDQILEKRKRVKKEAEQLEN